MNVNMLVSIADTIVSLVFTAMVLRQYAERRKMHQLLWSIALALWTVAVTAELLATIYGWSPRTYRLYYTAGALLIPAWLGMGTLYLVAPKRWAELTLRILLSVSVLGIALIAIWNIDATALKSTTEQFIPLRVFPFFPVQLLLIALNTFGSIAFVGGALWSMFHFVRQRTEGRRALAAILIAAGGIVAAIAHSMGVLGGVEIFRVSELVAVVLIFAGFVLSTPAATRTAQSAQAA